MIKGLKQFVSRYAVVDSYGSIRYVFFRRNAEAWFPACSAAVWCIDRFSGLVVSSRVQQEIGNEFYLY
jgi:hypothetical protein